MIAEKLYKQLEKDFIKPNYSDEWSNYGNPKFITQNWHNRFIGLFLDNTEEINSIYTAVFPSTHVIDELKKKQIKNSMLFTHHPMDWDIRKSPQVFIPISDKQMQWMKENKISIYTLHVPLDSNDAPNSIGTSDALAEALDLKIIAGLDMLYFGAPCGRICEVAFRNTEEIKNHFSKVVGHEAKLHNYSNGIIENNQVAFVAGGGNDMNVLIKTYLFYLQGFLL